MGNLKNHKLLITIGVILILIIGLPLIITLSQRQQDERSRAGASTTLYMTPNSSETTPVQKDIGETVSFDIMVNPGTNLPSLVKLELKYDPTKIQPLASNAFVANTTAFPQVVEGPLITNGNMLVSLSIGPDSTKAIQTPTKVGTVTFTTLAETTVASAVTFGTKSQVLSIALADQSTENVLSTTNPGYISIGETITPTVETTITTVPTEIITPTATITATLTPMPTIIATDSPTPITTILPTEILSPTTVPSSPPTTFSFTVFMHGIGNSGDNANPNEFSLSNKDPKHPTRSMQVFVYNVSNVLVASGPATITYASESGSFKGSINLGNTISPGLHTVKVQSADHLRKLVPGIQNVTPLQNNVMPPVTLVAGDVNNDNNINILDYNLFVGCYSDLMPPVSCNETTKVATDLNDDSFVNQFDYNMFLREISVQVGN